MGVVSAGAVNSAALLLRSATDKHPHGPGNSSDLLGRRYMVHNSTFLFVVDSSFFPSSAALNPALTIAANALRVAPTIARSAI